MRRKPALCDDNEPANPNASYYLSGIGEGIAYDGQAPPQGYDVRDHEDGDDFAPECDVVVAYTNRSGKACVPHDREIIASSVRTNARSV